VHPDAARRQATLEPALETRGVKYALFIGDQIIADAPRASSRYATRRSTRSAPATRPRYRQFWAFPEVRRLQARWPTQCIWDDHEVVNDWGARRGTGGVRERLAVRGAAHHE
jgi:phosphodiesterase/alkaline phosphatase D-like protein